MTLGMDGGEGADPVELVEAAGRLARECSPQMGSLSTLAKNDALHDIAIALVDHADSILAANERDVEAAYASHQSEALVDRLTLNRFRLGKLAEGVREVAAFADPVGEVLRGSRRPNGLWIKEVRVPIGVVGVVYESRPDVMVDAISLCLKSGNAVILLGGADVRNSTAAVFEVIRQTLDRQGIPRGAVQCLQTDDPAALDRFMRLTRYIDVLIPRGSNELIRRVCDTATIPTIETGAGNCHLFIEKTASLEMACDIALNAKLNRPGAVNAIETLLVDEPIAADLLPLITARLQAADVDVRGCERTCALAPSIHPATDEDFQVAYQDLTLAVRVVNGVDEAIRHIARYGTHLAEAIVTQDYSSARRFCQRVDAAAVLVNASTRFMDGYELGLGAELGISTQKLHRRGPIGIRALTTWKWVVQGDGQVRED